MITVTAYEPLNLKAKLKERICKFYQSLMDVKKKEVINTLEKRDLLYTFENDQTDKLAGTISVKWITHKNTVTAHIGSILLLEEHEQQYFLSNVIFQILRKTFLKFPGKSVYVSYLIDTPKMHHFMKHFDVSYPNDHLKKTAPYLISIMQNIALEIAGPKRFTADEDRFTMDAVVPEADVNIDEALEVVNPEYMPGKQLLKLHLITPMSLLRLSIAASKFHAKNMLIGAQEMMAGAYEYSLQKIRELA